MAPSFSSHSARPAGMSIHPLAVLLAFLVGLAWNPSAFAQPSFPTTTAVDGLTTSVPDTFFGIRRALLGIESPQPHFDANGDGQVDVADTQDCRIQNGQTGRIFGTIRDELSVPYRYSNCTLLRSMVPRHQTSDSAGNFIFSDVPVSEYRLEVAGSTVREETVWIPVNQEIPGLRPGDPEILVRFNLGGAVSLKVTDPLGAPIARFKIDVDSEYLNPNPPPGMASYVTDGYTSTCQTQDGMIVIPYLIPGSTVNVVVTAENVGVAYTGDVPVPQDGIGDAGTVQIGNGTVLEGRVVDEFGVPLSGVDVAASFEFPRSSRARTTTHTDGHYRFSHFSPGTVNLTLGSGNWVPQRIPGIIVEREQTVHLPDTVLVMGGSIIGHIYRSNGSVATSLPVTCGTVTTFTDAAGIYRLEGIPPGEQQLVVGWLGNADYTVRNIVVIPDEIVEVDVDLP